jgi:hypothetical protein
VGLGKDESRHVALVIADVGSTMPPLGSNVIVYSLSVHLAQNSLLPVLPAGIDVAALPVKLEFANQPANVKPSLVGIGKVISALVMLKSVGELSA